MSTLSYIPAMSHSRHARLEAVYARQNSRASFLLFSSSRIREAWTKVKGLSSDEAKSKYVAHFLAMLDADGSDESKANKALVSLPAPLFCGPSSNGVKGMVS